MHWFYFLGLALLAAGSTGFARVLLRVRSKSALRKSPVLRELRSFPAAERVGNFLVLLGFGIALVVKKGGGVWAVGALVSGLVGLELRRVLRAQALRTQFERAGLQFLYGLRGLLASGLDLSTALNRLSQIQATPFSGAFGRSLGRFEGGRTLGGCLNHFQSQIPDKLMAVCFSSLHLAYSEGAALLPLLDKTLAILESQSQRKRRILDFERSALAQAAVALVMPWGLWAFMRVMNPDTGALNGGLVGVVIAAEGIGLCLVRRLSCFG
jgi:Flp pilus assembly protein TadB